MEALLRNLGNFVRLSRTDRIALDRLREAPLRSISAREDLVREGEKPAVVRLLVSGWACNFKDLPDGRRQIAGFFLPGDFCDLNVYILSAIDHSIGALTDVTYLEIPPEMLQRLTDEHPRITRALLWHELVQSSIQREWLLNIGKRTSVERLAHLFVELYLRLDTIGCASEGTCELPLTQTDLADATGITPVHLNRTLQELRRENLIEFHRKTLKILDMERLKEQAIFNPNYLHLNHEGRHLDAND